VSFTSRVLVLGVFGLVLGLFASSRAQSQERPYFVTYDHYLEEPGNLEIEYFSTFGTQRQGNDFHAFWTEFEYGVKGWWTTEFYLSGQSTFNDSTVFTGFRWENRFRPLAREHFINPVLYVEYEHINGADKIMKEVEGHDGEADFGEKTEVVRDSQTTNIVSEAQKATASATTRGAGYPASARTPTMKVSRAISQASFPRIALM